MNVEGLRKIIEYSDAHRAEIESKVKDFCSFADMSSDKDILNIMQIVRPAFRCKDYLVLEMPFADREIGTFSYKGDALGYVVVNTSLPRVNVNFVICHELYHVFYQKTGFRSKVEFVNDHYYEQVEEFAANLFAGMLLMPESGFRFMYSKFKKESENNEIDTLIRLMNYYQVPYMAALIRCYELRLPDTDYVSEELLSMDQADIRKRFRELWLDESVLDATGKDDFPHLKELVAQVGNECIRDSFINERTLRKVLQNMQVLYSEIKGE